MEDVPSILWQGKSGKEYRYWVYTIGTAFNDRKGANYVFVKKTVKGSYKPIYIGQTSYLNEHFDNHKKIPCIKRNKASEIHVHINTDETSRLEEESDLLANYGTPCNRE